MKLKAYRTFQKLLVQTLNGLSSASMDLVFEANLNSVEHCTVQSENFPKVF